LTPDSHVYKGDEGWAVLGACGYVAVFCGALCIDAGIPLAIIGKKRLQWVADDYNSSKMRSSETPYVSISSGRNGLGLRLTSDSLEKTKFFA